MVDKRAQDPKIAHRKDEWRLIVPVWNTGLGFAVVRSVLARPSCANAEESIRKVPLKEKHRVGYYNVPAGGSEQLVYEIAEAHALRATTPIRTREGVVYRLNVTVRYTDPLIRRDRWNCIKWRRSKPDKRWVLDTQIYDDREVTGDTPSHAYYR